MTDKQPATPEEPFESNIFLIRGQKVMHSLCLAEAFGIEPQVVDQVVESNIERFMEGSVFRLKPEEFASLKSRHAVPGQEAPYAFTKQGAATLSSILFDERATYESRESCAPTCGCRK